MKNPNNILIRTSQATDEEMTGFIAWCEVCGMKNVYGAMYHDFTQDIIMCREHVGGPSITQLVEIFNEVNSDCMRHHADSVPFSDIDYYAEQIELIFGVTEIRAYELAEQLSKVTEICGDYAETTDTGCVHAYCNDIKKETTMFKMTGFKHVTEAGVKDYLQTMDSEGSIGLLWDISNQRRADILMQEAGFDMTTYCKRYSTTEEEFDNVMVDLHEELVDARFALEHAFIQNLDEITCPVGKRTFSGIQSVKSEDWNPKVYYPMTKEHVFTTRADMEKFIMDYFTMDTTDYDLIVTITAHPADDGDYDCDQVIPFRVTGACEFNLMLDLCGILESEGYTLTFTCNK